MPTLPPHLYAGRTNLGGPVAGTYMVFSGSSILAAIADADLIVWGFRAPCDFRIERIQWSGGDESITADADLDFYSNSAGFTVATGTALLAATVALDVAPEGYAEAASGGTTTLVAAAREVTRGDAVFVAATCDAVDGAIEGQGHNVHVVGFSRGHVNTDPAYD